MKAESLTHEKGMEYLKSGFDLISTLKDRSRMSLQEDGSIMWKGNKDKGPTFLKENETRSLFRGIKYYIVPSDWD